MTAPAGLGGIGIATRGMLLAGAFAAVTIIGAAALVLARTAG